MNSGDMKTRVLSNGLVCYVFPKKGYVEKQVALSVRYGAADLRWRVDGCEIFETPPGTAHFLEHKMFESAEMNVFSQFARQGAAVNAYTNYGCTAYYFMANDALAENIRLLFQMVREPYFTDENVEKEKEIILREIDMYRDDPVWALYMQLQRALFHQSPVRNDIAGTAESVSAMGKDWLLRCYESFYTPCNMALVAAGDLDAEEIFSLAEQCVGERQAGRAVTRLYGEEPSTAASPYVEASMPVSMPMMQIGFKEVINSERGEALEKITAAAQVLLEVLAGESSPLFARLYQAGLIDNQFNAGYIGGAFYGTSLFSGLSRSPKRVEEALLQEISRLKQEGLPKARFEIIKQKVIGRYLRELNRLDFITACQTDFHLKQWDIFSFLALLSALRLNDVEERLHKHLKEDQRALSVVWPAADTL